MQRGKVLGKASCQKELNAGAAVSIKELPLHAPDQCALSLSNQTSVLTIFQRDVMTLEGNSLEVIREPNLNTHTWTGGEAAAEEAESEFEAVSECVRAAKLPHQLTTTQLKIIRHSAK